MLAEDGADGLGVEGPEPGAIVPGTPAAAYAITGTSKCIASSSGTQKPSCSERQRYADARR